MVPVNVCFPLSAEVGTMVSGDDSRESTPSHWCWNTGSGPRRPIGDDRLMHMVTPLVARRQQAPVDGL